MQTFETTGYMSTANRCLLKSLEGFGPVLAVQTVIHILRTVFILHGSILQKPYRDLGICDDLHIFFDHSYQNWDGSSGCFYDFYGVSTWFIGKHPEIIWFLWFHMFIGCFNPFQAVKMVQPPVLHPGACGAAGAGASRRNLGRSGSNSRRSRGVVGMAVFRRLEIEMIYTCIFGIIYG